MASFGDQLAAAKAAHLAASSLEDQVRNDIGAAFDAWERGDLNDRTIRYRLESIIRNAYRGSAALAAEFTARQSGLDGWEPGEVFLTDYLRSLISDARRNLRDYKRGPRDEKSLRSTVLRMQHGAGVAAQRGYTDSLIANYGELEDFGYKLRKVWLANLDNNVPCGHCRALHGTEVGLREEFPTGTLSPLKVYGDLRGPPRHPRCRCYLAILIVSLENAFEELDIERPAPEPQSMSTDDVKRMPPLIWKAVVKTLRKIVSFVKRGSNG